MPNATIHAGREYVVTWAYLRQGVSAADAEHAAAIGTRSLGLEPLAVYLEPGEVIVWARGRQDGRPWVPVAVGPMQTQRIEALEGGSGVTTGALDPYEVEPPAPNVYAFLAGLLGRSKREAFAALEDAREGGWGVPWSLGREDGREFNVPMDVRAVLRVELGAVTGLDFDGLHWSRQGGREKLEIGPYAGPLARAWAMAQKGPKGSRTGAAAPAPAPACRLVEPTAGAYPVLQGRRYRALVSASAHFTADAIAKYLTDHGWSDVHLYEGDTAAPADWPSSEAPGELEANHRWLRGDAVRSGPDTAIDVVSSLHKIISIRLSIYRIAALWDCGAASPSTSSSSPPMVTLYAASWCKPCHDAANWLTAQGVPFVEYDVDKEPEARAELARKLAAAGRPDPGALPILDVRGRLLVGFSPDTVQAALSASGAPVALLHMGPSSGPGGLDASIPTELARSVETSWAFETDPNKLRGFAATLRQGGYPIAGSVLDQRALTVLSESPETSASATAAAAEKKRDRALKVGGILVGVAGVVVTIAAAARR